MMPAAIVGSSLLGAGAATNAGQTQANAANNATQVEQGMFNKTQQNLAPWMQGGNVALSSLMKGLGLNGGGPSLTGSTAGGGTSFNPSLLSDPAYMSAWQSIFGGPGQGDSTTWSPSDLSSALQAKLPQDWNQTHAGPDNGIGSGSLIKPFGMEDFQASPAYNFNLQQGQQAIDKASAARGNFYAPKTLQDISKFSQGLASNEFQNAYSNYNNNINNIYSRLSNISGGGQNAAANLGAMGTQVGGQIGGNIMSGGAASAAGGVGAANAISGGVGNAYNNYLTQQILSNSQRGSYDPNFTGDAAASMARSG